MHPSAQSLLQRHPLQRSASPSRGLSALLHITSLASFAYSFHYLSTTPNPINDSYGWHFQFLTIIGLSLATLSFSLGLLADITLNPTLFLLKNAFSVAAAPLEVLISLLYWSLRSIDPKLVLPDFAPPMHVPTDISFHVVPAAVLILDLLFFSPPWTIAVGPACLLSSAIAIAYWAWVEQCYKYNGYYPYPIFDQVGFGGRVVLFTGSAVVMAVATWCLQLLYGFINGRELVDEKPGDLKKKA